MKKIVLPLLIFILCSCSAKTVKTDFFAMDTFMSISLLGSDADVQVAEEEIRRLDKLLRYDSIDVNNTETKELIDFSNDVSRFTEGAFDITISPLMELWGFRDKNYTVPGESALAKALENVGYDKITDKTMYDFGAVGKGYAGDKVREKLLSRGVNSAILSLGGNVHAIGTKPDGKSWSVGIQNPDDEGYIGYVNVENKAVVTSGGYERYFESDGKKYSHIINPKTGRPAENDIKSITVICEKGALADALSTGFFVMGSEKTQELCKKTENKFNDIEFAVIIIKTNGEILEIGNIELKKAR